MLSRLREHFGTAGLVVAIVALVAALAGGAIAANGGSGGGKATASAKAKQGKQGPRGKTGKTGPQGPAGSAGPAGPQGPAGPKGDNGAPGANGSDGAQGATGATGPAGKNSLTGFTEVLPSGKTETGIWGPVNVASPKFTVSFPIPVEPEPEAFVFLDEEETVKVMNEEEVVPGCPGISAGGVPLADPGTLCVYARFGSNVALTFSQAFVAPGGVLASGKAGPTGVNITTGMRDEELGFFTAQGVWAVTAK